MIRRTRCKPAFLGLLALLSLGLAGCPDKMPQAASMPMPPPPFPMVPAAPPEPAPLIPRQESGTTVQVIGTSGNSLVVRTLAGA